MKPTEAQIEETEIDGPRGKPVDGVMLTCGDCDTTVECPGYDSPDTRAVLQDKLCKACPERRCTKFKILL